MKNLFIGIILSVCLSMLDALGAPAADRFRTKVEFTYQTNGIKSLRAEDWGDDRPLIEVGEDSSWNWGNVSEGVEMGARFTRNAYGAGQSIELEILVRNVSQQPSHFAGGAAPIDDFKITLSDDQNRTVPELRDLVPSTEADFQRRLNRAGARSNPKPYPLLPGTQHIYVIRLDELFDLSRPGKYFVTATHGVPKLDGSGYNEVNSGTAIAEVPGDPKRASLSNPGQAKTSESKSSSSLESSKPEIAPPSTNTAERVGLTASRVNKRSMSLIVAALLVIGTVTLLFFRRDSD